MTKCGVDYDIDFTLNHTDDHNVVRVTAQFFEAKSNAVLDPMKAHSC